MLERTIGPFGLKDVFTLVNLVSGVAAVGFALEGEVRHAGYAVIVGFLAGDLVDGTVARRTGTANRFGAEFDSITDHFVHVFVPGMVMYSVYQRGHHAALGFAALTLLIAGASIRHARFAAARFDFPLCWCGLPRTISGFAALSFPLSSMFARTSLGYLLGFVIVAVLSALNLVPIPYMTHRGQRAMQLYVKIPVLLFLLSAPVAFLVARRYTFDVFFLGMIWFALTGWFPVKPDERRAFSAEYRRWSVEVAGERHA
ncbi:MAG: CDP-alcohol phosphatidyltransferase family protein [Acidimicrobiales bacterium]